MPQILSSDDYAGKAQAEWNEAIAILQDPDADLQDLERAEALQKSGGQLMERSKALTEIRGNIDKLKGAANEGENNPLNNEGNPEKPEESKGFATVGHYLRAAYHLRINGIGDERLKFFDDGDTNKSVTPATTLKALAENVGATGGFLVPEEFHARVLAIQATDALIRPGAEVIPMARRTAQIPSLDQTGTTVGTPSFFGGITASWTEEAGTIDETEPSFRNVLLTAHTLSLYTRASDQLLDDSAISLEAFLMGANGFPGAMVWYEDFNFLQGDGVGKPQGIINSGALIATARVAANLVDYTDVTNMMANLMPSSNAVWIASQSVFQQLMIMEGPSGNPSFLWGNAEQGFPPVLLGLPILFTDKLPILGGPHDIILVDRSKYLIGDRQMITIDMSREERFRNNQIAWRANMRIDGQGWLSAPITYQDGTTTVSPFVGLAAG